jgi:hypothetical protein
VEGLVRAILPFACGCHGVFNPSVTIPADHGAVQAHMDKFVRADISDLELSALQGKLMAEDSKAAADAARAQVAAYEAHRQAEAERFHEESLLPYRKAHERRLRELQHVGPPPVREATGAVPPHVLLAKAIADAFDRRDDAA